MPMPGEPHHIAGGGPALCVRRRGEGARAQDDARGGRVYGGRDPHVCILSNHWHILLYVPNRQEITDTELGRRLGLLYDSTVVGNVMGHLAGLRESGQLEAEEAFKAQYTRRPYRRPLSNLDTIRPLR